MDVKGKRLEEKRIGMNNMNRKSIYPNFSDMGP